MLSEYKNKGECGAPEIYDDPAAVSRKVKTLAGWVRSSAHTVVYTGAGISTSAGIPDFRGPNGVWTREARGLPSPSGAAWAATRPTPTHRAINALVRAGLVGMVVSQNVDGLHLRSGLQRDRLSELHGNVFMEKCARCGREFLRDFDIKSVGLKPTGRRCGVLRVSTGGRSVRCRGLLHDTTLDWEDVLPEPDFSRANEHSAKSTLSITLGTSLQINPAGEMPLGALENKDGHLVIVNLQRTPHDARASLVIHAKVDQVTDALLKELGVSAAPVVDAVDKKV